jgi:hypothetical protein
MHTVRRRCGYRPPASRGYDGSVRVTAIALFAALAACDAPAPNEHLTSVDYWPEEGVLFVGLPRSGAIDVLRVPQSPRQGSLDFIERLTDASRHEVQRIAVDRAHRRLWVADRRAIYVYPLQPRGPATSIAFGPAGDAPISDLVIDPDGNGYVFVAGGARIFRVDAATLRSELWLETSYASRQSAAPLSGRALLTRDGREVIFQSPGDGSLVRVDLRSRHSSRIERDSPIALDCATFLWNADGNIAAFHCRGRSIGEIRLGGAMRHSVERYLTLQR